MTCLALDSSRNLASRHVKTFPRRPDGMIDDRWAATRDLKDGDEAVRRVYREPINFNVVQFG